MIALTATTSIGQNSKTKSGVVEKQHFVTYHGAPSKGKILMVASSPSVSKQTGWPIGFWAAELTHPLRVFTEAGYEVELASTEGGKIEMDGYSNPLDASGYSAHDVITLGYMQLPWFNNMLANTKKLSEVKASDYAAIFLVGVRHPCTLSRIMLSCNSCLSAFTKVASPQPPFVIPQPCCSMPKSRMEHCLLRARHGPALPILRKILPTMLWAQRSSLTVLRMKHVK